MTKVSSVILLSGGLDSSANLALAQEFDLPVMSLFFDYGQKALSSELKAAQRFSEYYSVPLKVIDLKWLKQLGSSGLTSDHLSIPNLETSDLDNLEITQASRSKVWVPNRNGILLSVAAAFAESLSADRIVVGFNREEASTFPDNSKDYLNAFNLGLEFSTLNRVQVHSYTVDMDKVAIVSKLKTLQKPFLFESVWSCYHSGEKLCEKCESCKRLRRAYEANGL